MLTKGPSQYDHVDWAVVVGFAMLFCWAVLDVLAPSPTPSEPFNPVSDANFALSERAVERLEAGETVEIERWHGDPLVIGAVDEEDE